MKNPEPEEIPGYIARLDIGAINTLLFVDEIMFLQASFLAYEINYNSDTKPGE